MGLFAKAAAKTEATKKASKPKKNTTWLVGDPKGDAVGQAVHTLVELDAQEKAIKAKMGVAKTVVLTHAKESHVRDFCSLGVPPDTPMLVQNSDGEKVTFVVQDRSGQYSPKQENLDAMAALLGDGAADELTYTETSIGFDRTMLAIPGVSDAIEKALERVITKLVKDEVLTADQAGELIVVNQKTSFKPGTLERAAQIVGNDTTKMSQFLDAMGSCCVRYVKP